MHTELNVAVKFIVSHLYNKLPRRRVNLFAEELERCLMDKFQGHWYVDDACKGSAFRCIRVTGEKMDPAVIVALQLSGLEIVEVLQIIPEDLTLWIDPNEVTYRSGEHDYMKLLYTSRNQNDCELDTEVGKMADTSRLNTFQPIEIAPGNLRVSPISPSTSPGTFTAAMFAQTKFGSTKLKSNKKQCPSDIGQRADEPEDTGPWRQLLLAN